MASEVRICVFGCFEDSDLYMRNRVLIEALSASGATVELVRPEREGVSDNLHRRTKSLTGLIQYGLDQIGAFVSLFRQRRQVRTADLIFVPYPAYLDGLFLRLINAGSSRKPVVIDAFLCLHETVVTDRQVFQPKSIGARLTRWIEAHALSQADRVFIDTPQQKAILDAQYGLDPGKVAVVPVGLLDRIWAPIESAPSGGPFRVIFWGTFIPLHGTTTLLQAARLLAESAPGVEIEIIGDGQEASRFAEELERDDPGNIRWRRTLLPTESLRQAIAQAHLVLGVFADSEKAASVVPYKVHQALACNRPVVTRSSPAMAELAAANNNIVLVPPENPRALADAIVQMQSSVGEDPGTRKVYDEFCSQQRVEQVVTDVIREVLHD